MGRSVSVPRGAICIAYRDISELGMVQQVDKDGNELDEVEWDDFIGQIEFDDLIADITEQVMDKWKSMDMVENVWLGDEDRVLAENGLAYFGTSTYCGLMSIWMAPKDYDDTYDERTESLANHWCNQISDKFDQMFGDLVRIGGFSDGTSVYERKQA